MNKPFADVMVDIETLSTQPNAFVTQISAIAFDKEFNIIDTFSINIDVWQRQLGAHIDTKTVEFWQEQPRSVKKNVFGGVASAEFALAGFNAWLDTLDINKIWANSPSFDLVILNDMFNRIRPGDNNLPKFYKWLDVRTIKHIGTINNIDFSDLVNKHDSLDDCRNQIEILKRVYTKLSLGEK